MNSFVRVMALLAVLPGALALGGCDEPAPVVAEPVPRAVKAIAVTEGDAAERRTFPAVLTATDTVRLSFPVAGRILEAPLREGQRVTRGQVVARLDPADAERELASADARLAAARVRLEVADAEFRRQQTLFERGLIARAAFDRVSAEVTTARSELRLAETMRAGAEDRLGRLNLEAPSDGDIVAALANPFEEIAPGAPVYEMAVTADLQAEFFVPEQIVALLAVGHRAEVRLPSRPGETFEATVSEIAAAAEAGAAFRVKARLNATPDGARTGLSASVMVDLPRGRGAMEVPLSALVFSTTRTEPTAGSAASVFVFDTAAGRLALRRVRIDGIAGDRVLVTEGLDPGEHVVTAGVALLEDGQSARLWTPPE